MSLKACLFALLLALSALNPFVAQAAEKSFTKGSVWIISLIRVEPGHDEDYVDSLKEEYTKVIEEAIKQKLVLSYHFLQGEAANPSDFSVLIAQELPNYAAFDTLEQKMDDLEAKAFGSDDKATDAGKKAMAARAQIRQIFGSKVMQEIKYKK